MKTAQEFLDLYDSMNEGENFRDILVAEVEKEETMPDYYMLAYEENEKEIYAQPLDIDSAEIRRIAAGKSNIAEYNLQVFTSSDDDQKRILNLLDDLVPKMTSVIWEYKQDRGKLLLQKCNCCGKFFWINHSESDWFEKKNLRFPRKCHKCRQEAKEQREKKGEEKE